MKEEIYKLAKIIWDYHHLNNTLDKADCIFVLCSHDIRVAEYASDLYLKGYAPYIIFSGGAGVLTKNIFSKPEADIFSEIALFRGVPKDKIIIENKSSNTGENVLFTKKILNDMNLEFDSYILVQKPYMERRTYATFMKIWPDKRFTVTSPQISLKDYANSDISEDSVINVMVGDLQRIMVYPERGFQIHQEVPKEVIEAYDKLVNLGYNKHLIKD